MRSGNSTSKIKERNPTVKHKRLFTILYEFACKIDVYEKQVFVINTYLYNEFRFSHAYYLFLAIKRIPGVKTRYNGLPALSL